MPDLPPLPRILRSGSTGRDVRALQHALQAAGVRQEPATAKPTTFDEQTDDEVRALQRRHHLFVDGEVGEDTYGVLAPFYDARGLKLLSSIKEASPDTIRRKIAKPAHCGFVDRDEVHYTQQAGTRWDGDHGRASPTRGSRSAMPPSETSPSTARADRTSAT